MPAEKFVIRFAVYPQDMSKFLQYCERFQVIKDTEIIFTKEQEEVEPDSFIWKFLFVCDVTFYSQKDALIFINVFSLLFSLSKYCSEIYRGR